MPRGEHLKEYHWKKGESGNPNGRPKGSVSVITALKQRFEENPEEFKEFLDRYIKNTQNEKHITEMIDGKPKQSTDLTSGGQPITFTIAEEIAKKNDLT